MLEDLRPWAVLAIMFFQALFTLYLFRRTSTKEAVAALDKRFDAIAVTAKGDVAAVREEVKLADQHIEGLHNRLSAVEGEIKHLPTKDQVHALHLGMMEINGKVREQSQVLEAVKATAQRVENFLLEHK